MGVKMNVRNIAISIAIFMLAIIFLFSNSSLAEELGVKVIAKYGANGDPGYIVYHGFEVKNTGTNRQSYVLTVSCEHNWNATFVESVDYGLFGEEIVTRQLESGESIPVDIKVEIPHFDIDTYLEDGTWAFENATLQLRAKCYSNRLIEDSNTTQTMVNLIHTVKLEAIPENLEVESIGERDDIKRRTATYIINVTHICNDIKNTTPKEILVSMYPPEGDWIPESNKLNKTEDNLTLNLKVRESCNITLDVIAPVNVSMGKCTIIVLANLTDDATKYDTAITYTTVLQKPGVEIVEVYPERQYGRPEDILTYSFKIKNTGNANDSYDIIVSSDHGWKINATNRINDLGSNEIEIVNVTIKIPAREPIGTNDTLTLKAISVASQSSIYASKTAVTTVIQGYSVDLEPENITGKVTPNHSITYQINVTNTGNGEDTIKFEVEKYVFLNWRNMSLGSTNWGVTTPSLITLKTGEKETIEITVRAPKYVHAFTNLTIFLTAYPSDNGKEDTINITTIVNEVHGVKVVATGKEDKGKPGERIVLDFKITNLGNIEDFFILEAKTEHNWTTHIFLNNIETSLINISRYGEMVDNKKIDFKIVQVEVVVGDALAGEKEALSLTATSKSDLNATDSDNVTITVEQVYNVYLSSDKRKDKEEQRGHKLILGGRTKYWVEVRNIGNGEDTFDISVSVENQIFGEKWKAFVSSEVVALEARTSIFIETTVEAPTTAEWGSTSPPIKVIAKSKGDVNATDETVLPTSIIANFDFTKEDNFHFVDHDTNDVCTVIGYVYPNKVIKYQFDIANANGESKNFTISKPKSHRGWNYSLSDENFRLGDYSKYSVILTVIAPNSENASVLFGTNELPEENVNIYVRTEDGQEDSIKIITRLLRLDLRVKGIKITGKLIEGENIKINATILAYGESVEHSLHNNVTNIFVDVYIEGKKVHSQTIPNLLKGQYANIEFNWTISNIDWKKKKADINITVVIVKYSTIAGSDVDFEKNNNNVSYYIIVNDSPLIGTNYTFSSVVTLIIILLLIIIILGLDLKMKKKKSFKLIGLSLTALSISLLLAFIFILPWTEYFESISNYIANIIILSSFFAIFPIMTLYFSIRARSNVVSMFVAIVPFIAFCLVATVGNDFTQFTEALSDVVTIGGVVFCILIGIITSYITYKAYYFAGQQIANISEMCRRIRGEIYGSKTEKR